MILYGTIPTSFWVIGSSNLRPIRRLMAKKVCSGLVTAWRFADCPTRRSPSLVNATMDGVVRAPSAFSMTFGWPPSMMATHELVVPRSIPMTLDMLQYLIVRQTVRALMQEAPGPFPGSSGFRNGVPRFLAAFMATYRGACSPSQGTPLPELCEIVAETGFKTAQGGPPGAEPQPWSHIRHDATP